MTKLLVKAVMFNAAKASGQTALHKQLANTDSEFSHLHRLTVGADFRMVNKGNVALQLWETASDPRFVNDGLDYLYKKASIVIYCVDLSKRLDQVQIIADIERLQAEYPEALISLVGTKQDIAEASSLEVFQDLRNNSAVKHSEITSAKDKTGVSALRDSLFDLAMQKLNPVIARQQLLSEIDDKIQLLNKLRDKVAVGFSPTDLEELQQKLTKWVIQKTDEVQQDKPTGNVDRNRFFLPEEENSSGIPTDSTLVEQPNLHKVLFPSV